jgi:hypothetical protein
MLSVLNKPFMLSGAMLSVIMPSVIALEEWGAFSTLFHLKHLALSLNYKHLLYLSQIKALALLCIKISLSKQSQASLLGLNYFCIYFPV